MTTLLLVMHTGFAYGHDCRDQLATAPQSNDHLYLALRFMPVCVHVYVGVCVYFGNCIHIILHTGIHTYWYTGTNWYVYIHTLAHVYMLLEALCSLVITVYAHAHTSNSLDMQL